MYKQKERRADAIWRRRKRDTKNKEKQRQKRKLQTGMKKRLKVKKRRVRDQDHENYLKTKHWYSEKKVPERAWKRVPERGLNKPLSWYLDNKWNHCFYKMFTLEPQEALLGIDIDPLIAKTIIEFLYIDSYQFSVIPMSLEFEGDLETRRIEVGDGILKDITSTEGLTLTMNAFPLEDLSAFEELCMFDDHPFYKYVKPCPTVEPKLCFPHDKILYQFEQFEQDQRQDWIENLQYGLVVYSAYERYICALTYGANVELRVLPIRDYHKMKRFFHNLSKLRSAADPDDLYFLDELTLIMELSPDESYLNVSKSRSELKFSVCYCERCDPEEYEPWETPPPYSLPPMETPILRKCEHWKRHRDVKRHEVEEWVMRGLELTESRLLLNLFKRSVNLSSKEDRIHWKRYVRENGSRDFDPNRHPIAMLKNYLMLPEVNIRLHQRQKEEQEKQKYLVQPFFDDFDVPEFFLRDGSIFRINQKIVDILEKKNSWWP